jgi:hypothetical protein
MKLKLSDYQVFWDNGKYVAIRTGHDGVRRNIAPYNCQSKKAAIEAARDDRNFLNQGRGDCGQRR